MSKLLISTQVYENYSEDLTDGDYWKAKGGNDYVVKGVDECDMIDVIVDRVRGQIECDTNMYREYIVSYSVVADDFLTWYEQSQLDYDGEIRYPAIELTV